MGGELMVGVAGLSIVLVLVAALAVLRGRYDGRIRDVGGPDPSTPGGIGQQRHAPGAAVDSAPSLRDTGIALPPDTVTVVQFSGEFCAVCPQARTLVERVLVDHPGIGHVEVDVADHLEAVRALDIRRTPTLIIVDRYGRAVHRASGMPREAELRRAVADLAARG